MVCYGAYFSNAKECKFHTYTPQYTVTEERQIIKARNKAYYKTSPIKIKFAKDLERFTYKWAIIYIVLLVISISDTTLNCNTNTIIM